MYVKRKYMGDSKDYLIYESTVTWKWENRCARQWNEKGKQKTKYRKQAQFIDFYYIKFNKLKTYINILRLNILYKKHVFVAII